MCAYTCDLTDDQLILVGFLPPTYLATHEEVSSHIAENDFSSFLKGIITPTQFDATNAANFALSQELHGLLDFTIDGSFGFGDIASGFSHMPPATTAWIPNMIEPRPFDPMTTEHDDGEQEHLAIGIAAYKESTLGAWEPSGNDQGGSGIESLSVLGPSPPGSLNLYNHMQGHSFLSESLSVTERDDILSMVLNACRADRRRLVTKAFPTPSLLDKLINFFFAYHRKQPDAFIHEASFKISQQRPELLAAIIASGATLGDSRSLHSVGFAIQEAVRISLHISAEEQNSVVRELWVLQTFICEIGVGLWSGVKRKMEIAESHRHNPYTVSIVPVESCSDIVDRNICIDASSWCEIWELENDSHSTGSG